MTPERKPKEKEPCWHHDWKPFIDPRSGLFRRCKKCGLDEDLEDPNGDLG